MRTLGRIALAAGALLGIGALVALALVAWAGGGWPIGLAFCAPLAWIAGCVALEWRPRPGARELEAEKRRAA